MTTTFLFTGAQQVYTVPAAATAVHVSVVGAPGGRGGNGTGVNPGLGGAGGFGDVVDADLPVTPGGLLYVEVGAPGQVLSGSGGFGGAGPGVSGQGSGGPSGSGGGASDVRTCSMTAVMCTGGGTTLTSRMLVAGGGGGGGAGTTNSAGKGGNAFSAGEAVAGETGGGAGSASTPCTSNGGTNNGQSGGFGFGGSGGFATASMNYGGGGGGGGGYCGGGGGGASDLKPGSGGGGGSSFLQTNTVDIPTATDNTGVPKVTIRYTDLTAPAITIRVPGAGESYRQGSTVAADYACTDDQGGAGVATCDGPVPSGRPLDTSTPGLHHFTVATSDRVGNSITRTVDYTVVATAATISGATQSASTWRLGSALPTIARAKPPVGTTFSFTLDRQASVLFSFTRSVAGRRAGTKCVRPTRRNAGKRRCKRTVVAGRLPTFQGHAGVNRVRFQGRISRTKRLKPGRYSLVITATTAQGLKSSPKRLSFTIVR